MEISATRDQIRSRLVAKVGWASAVGVEDHYNELIRSASVQVAEECPWATARREARIPVGVDQRMVPYPDGCGATGIQEVGLWIAAGQFYKRLSRHTISVVRDADPTAEVGGADRQVQLGEPVWYEPGQFIELWPPTDQAYEIKVIYTLTVELTSGAQVSACDAELILLWAAADAYQQIGDVSNANDCRAKYKLRLDKIMRRTQTAFCVPLAPEAMEDEQTTGEHRGFYAAPVI
jgi:hypothetical protein